MFQGPTELKTTGTEDYLPTSGFLHGSWFNALGPQLRVSSLWKPFRYLGAVMGLCPAHPYSTSGFLLPKPNTLSSFSCCSGPGLMSFCQGDPALPRSKPQATHSQPARGQEPIRDPHQALLLGPVSSVKGKIYSRCPKALAALNVWRLMRSLMGGPLKPLSLKSICLSDLQG